MVSLLSALWLFAVLALAARHEANRSHSAARRLGGCAGSGRVSQRARPQRPGSWLCKRSMMAATAGR
jgi:hypothetical protein